MIGKLKKNRSGSGWFVDVNIVCRCVSVVVVRSLLVVAYVFVVDNAAGVVIVAVIGIGIVIVVVVLVVVVVVTFFIRMMCLLYKRSSEIRYRC